MIAFWCEMLPHSDFVRCNASTGIAGFEYFIFRWFVKIILIAMRLDGYIHIHIHTHTWKLEKSWERKKNAIHSNSHEYTSTTFQKEFASNAIEYTMTANKKSALAIELKRLLCSSHSCTLFACLFSYLRLEER